MRFSITIDTEDEEVALRLLGALKDVGLVQATEAVVEAADVRILPHTRQVLLRDEPVELTRFEFELPLPLCDHPDRVHRRRDLLSAVWGVNDNYSRAVGVGPVPRGALLGAGRRGEGCRSRHWIRPIRPVRCARIVLVRPFQVN